MDKFSDEREFDQFLKDRYVPDVSSNLAHRIIDASESQTLPVPFHVKFMKGLGQWFAIPQPAFALAAVAILSVGAVGLYSSDALVVEPTAEYYQEAEEVELAFYLDDIFDVDY